MSDINPHACREGFEQQRKAGINVDWFTWQIAWHDAMFTQVDTAPPPASTNQLTDAQIDALTLKHLLQAGIVPMRCARVFARAIIAATETKP